MGMRYNYLTTNLYYLKIFIYKIKQNIKTKSINMIIKIIIKKISKFGNF